MSSKIRLSALQLYPKWHVTWHPVLLQARKLHRDSLSWRFQNEVLDLLTLIFLGLCLCAYQSPFHKCVPTIRWKISLFPSVRHRPLPSVRSYPSASWLGDNLSLLLASELPEEAHWKHWSAADTQYTLRHGWLVNDSALRTSVVETQSHTTEGSSFSSLLTVTHQRKGRRNNSIQAFAHGLRDGLSEYCSRESSSQLDPRLVCSTG